MFGFKKEESIALYVALEEITNGQVYFSEHGERGMGFWSWSDSVGTEGLCVSDHVNVFWEGFCLSVALPAISDSET